MSADEPGVAGALAAELAAEGELVDAGGFSIDAGQARRKLQAFQVADPRAYLLMLVEAAVLAGADPVTISTDEGVTIELGEVAIRADELAQLFAAVFVELEGLDAAERARRRVLQKLAFACNTALRLEPRAVEVEVVGDELLRLRLSGADADGAGTVEREPRPAERSTGVRVRVVHRLASAAKELELVRERCEFTRHRIYVDGEAVHRGPAWALHVDTGLDDDVLGFETSNARGLRPVRDAEGREIGVIGFRLGSREPARVLILTNGVLAEDRRLDEDSEWAPGLVAVVELDLPKDLGHTQVLRGPEYAAVIAAIRAAHERIMARRQRRAASRAALEARAGTATKEAAVAAAAAPAASPGAGAEAQPAMDSSSPQSLPALVSAALVAMLVLFAAAIISAPIAWIWGVGAGQVLAFLVACGVVLVGLGIFVNHRIEPPDA